MQSSACLRAVFKCIVGFVKLCLVCIPVAGVVTGNIISTATNATASTNTNANRNTDISNNAVATTTTVVSQFCVNQ
jgi:hypothetical protein